MFHGQRHNTQVQVDAQISREVKEEQIFDEWGLKHLKTGRLHIRVHLITTAAILANAVAVGMSSMLTYLPYRDCRECGVPRMKGSFPGIRT